MNGYDLFLSDGELLTTIKPKTIDNQRSSSLVLIGQGVPSEWKMIDQDLVWLLENFSKPTPPPNPLRGQSWYDNAHGRMNIYTGEDWFYLETAETSCDTMFDMLDTATDIDFTVAGSTPIFTAADPQKLYCPMRLILVPREVIAPTAAIINLSVLESGDVLESTSVPNGASNKAVQLPTNNCPRTISGSSVGSPYGRGSFGIGAYSRGGNAATTVFLNITTPATAEQLTYDAYLYGFVATRNVPPPIVVNTPITHNVEVFEAAATTDASTSPGYGEGLYGTGLYGRS